MNDGSETWTYAPDQWVVLTFTGVQATTNETSLSLSNLTYKGESPVACDTDAGWVSYVVPMPGGSVQEFGAGDFAWPGTGEVHAWDTWEYGCSGAVLYTNQYVLSHELHVGDFYNEVLEVLIPHGDPAKLPGHWQEVSCPDYVTPSAHLHNQFVWRQSGIQQEMLSTPNVAALVWQWRLGGFDYNDAGLIISWTPDYRGNSWIGCGVTPTLSVEYDNTDLEYLDVLPPNNSYFGEKTIHVDLVPGGSVASRPVRIFFDKSAKKRWHNGDPDAITEVPSWYYYWRQGAVPALQNFEYRDDETYAGSLWLPAIGDLFWIGSSGASSISQPVWDSQNPEIPYSEVSYLNGEGQGIDCAAKLCEHESWHAILRREVRHPDLGGQGLQDSDEDELCDTREYELGTKPFGDGSKDTSHLVDHPSGGAKYAGYADAELFCRFKQNGVTGNRALDWAAPGKQYAAPW